MKLPYEILESPIIAVFNRQKLRVTPSKTVHNTISISTFKAILLADKKITSAELLKRTGIKPSKFVNELKKCTINNSNVFAVNYSIFGKTRLIEWDFAVKSDRFFFMDYKEVKHITKRAELLLLLLSKRFQKINTQKFLISYFLGIEPHRLKKIDAKSTVRIVRKIKRINNIIGNAASKHNATIEPGRIAVGKWTAPFPEKITFNGGKK